MAIVVEDNFNIPAGPDVHLSDHIATVTGGQWALFDNTTFVILEIQAVDDYVEPSSNASSGREIYASKPDPTEADVDVQVEMQQVDSNSDDDPFFVFARATDTDNLISLGAYRNSVNNNFQIHEKVSGVDSLIASANATISGGDKIKLELRGTTAKGYHDSGSGFVEILSGTVTGAAAGACGLGVGNLWSGNDDVRRLWHFDNYLVEEFAAGGGGTILPLVMQHYHGGIG